MDLVNKLIKAINPTRNRDQKVKDVSKALLSLNYEEMMIVFLAVAHIGKTFGPWAEKYSNETSRIKPNRKPTTINITNVTKGGKNG